ncbi:MAG TPA: hypothetical protein VIW70_14065 [Rubrivivax sp.]
MNTTITSRLASLLSAAMLTLAMFAGINALAVSDAPADQMARIGATAQG